MVQECNGPTATEPTAACWPILETTRCTATGCWSKGVSGAPRLFWKTWENGVLAEWRGLLAWICCAPDLNTQVLIGTSLVVSCLFPNGAWRKTSDTSTGLWDATLVSFAGVLKGASWKTSEANWLSGGWNWDSWSNSVKWRLVRGVCLVWCWLYHSSVSNMCLS